MFCVCAWASLSINLPSQTPSQLLVNFEFVIAEMEWFFVTAVIAEMHGVSILLILVVLSIYDFPFE